MAEVIWRIGVDTAEAKRAGKEFSKASESSGGSGSSGAAGGAFGGGLIGSLLGSLLQSVKSLFDPLSAIASLLIIALFPIFKPFLILFLKVGLLLFKFLNKMLGTDSPVSGLGGKTDEGDTVVGSLGKKIALWAGIVVGIIAAIVSVVGGLSVSLAVIIGLLTVLFWKTMIEGLIQTALVLWDFAVFVWDLLVKAGGWLSDKWKDFIAWLSPILKEVVDMIKEKWKDFLEILSKSWEKLKTLGTWIWDALVKTFTTAFESVKNLGTWIWDTLKTTFTNAFEALKGIGKWILRKIKSFLPFGGGSDSAVNDAIITPNGDIIRTNPSDYLIATKNPGALMGGSGSSNINVTVNGGMITEEVAKDIGKIILREVNVGGGF